MKIKRFFKIVLVPFILNCMPCIAFAENQTEQIPQTNANVLIAIASFIILLIGMVIFNIKNYLDYKSFGNDDIAEQIKKYASNYMNGKKGKYNSSVNTGAHFNHTNNTQETQRMVDEMNRNIDEMNRNADEMNRFGQKTMEESQKATTPFDHGGYVQGVGFNPSDTMAHEAFDNMNSMNDMNNMNGMM